MQKGICLIGNGQAPVKELSITIQVCDGKQNTLKSDTKYSNYKSRTTEEKNPTEKHLVIGG